MPILKIYITHLEIHLTFSVSRFSEGNQLALSFFAQKYQVPPYHFSFWLLLLGATSSRKAQGEL